MSINSIDEDRATKCFGRLGTFDACDDCEVLGECILFARSSKATQRPAACFGVLTALCPGCTGCSTKHMCKGALDGDSSYVTSAKIDVNSAKTSLAKVTDKLMEDCPKVVIGEPDCYNGLLEVKAACYTCTCRLICQAPNGHMIVVPRGPKNRKWDKRFLNLAKEIASWSKDPDKKCGALIVDEGNNIVSSGHNGFPSGCPDVKELLNNKELKRDLTVHAEANAILRAGCDLKGHTIYIWPEPPCIACATLIVRSGISTVVTINKNLTEKSYWAASQIRALILLAEPKVKVSVVKYNKEDV